MSHVLDGKFGVLAVLGTVHALVIDAITLKALVAGSIIQLPLLQPQDVSIQSVQQEYFPAVDLNVSDVLGVPAMSLDLI